MRLAAGVEAADQQLSALDTQADRLQRELGPASQIRAERDGLNRRVADLERETRGVRDEVAEREVAQPPAWARQMFGVRPEQYRRAEQYDRGVREAARYRVEHHVADETPGLGPEPDAGADRSASPSRRSGAWAATSPRTSTATSASTFDPGVRPELDDDSDAAA